MKKRMYMVGAVYYELDCEIGEGGIYGKSPLKLSWVDGQIGACPVFSNKKKAQKFAGKKFEITGLIVERK